MYDSGSTHLPQVVMEGRRVIHNVTRTAQVFFIKTIYSVLVSLFCLAANQPFPFIPIQITLIDACIEAYPSLLTIMESDTRRIRGRLLPTALSHAAPFGLTAMVMIILLSLLVPFSAAQRQTVMYILLILISMAAAVKSSVPFSLLRIFVCVTMALGTFGTLFLLPSLFEVSAVTPAMGGAILAGAVLSLIFLFCLEQMRKLLTEKEKQKTQGGKGAESAL